MPDRTPSTPSDDYPETDTVMRASRVFTGFLAASVSATGESVTAPQLRALVLVATRPPMNATLLAEALQIHPSTGTRLCDRLVSAGWLERVPSDADRRHVELHLSPGGEALVRRIMAHRRRAIREVLGRMTSRDRHALRRCLTQFCDAAGEPETAW